MSANRNDACPCGSGKKYKKCCINNDGIDHSKKYKISALALVVVLALAAGVYYLASKEASGIVLIGGLISIGAYIVFSDPPPPTSGGSPGAINFGQ
ncbi:MAG: SEC-C domain-containing protein [Deltaproteobacteria bacterium]|nr:SEC-C domain-containing protein [Deltaproteobacteria bacterium]